MRNKIKTKKGVTLVELVVVLALIAILAAIPVVASFGSLDNVNAQACRASCDAIFAYWNVHNRLTGDNTYTAEEAIAYCLSAGAGLDSVKACPGGGVYSVQYSGGEQKKVADKIVCSVHDKKRGTIEQDLQQSMANVIDAIKNGQKPGNLVHLINDDIRKYMYQQYGNQWPTMEVAGQKIYLQPYYNETLQEVTAVFGRTEDGGGNGWNISYLFNSETNTWYQRKSGGNSDWMKLSKQGLNDMLNNKENGWTPIPDEEIKYDDWK